MWSLEHKADKNYSTQAHIPQIYLSPQYLSKIVKAFERTNVQLHGHLSLQAYTHISIQVGAHVRVDIIRVNINAYDHAIVKAFEYRSI